MSANTIAWNDPLSVLPGIGPAREAEIAGRGVLTVGDFLRVFPREYILPGEKRPVADVRPGEKAVLDVRLRSIRLLRKGWRRSVVEGEVGDETGEVRCLWFQVPYLARTLRPGSRMIVQGALSGSPPAFLHPRFEVVRDGEAADFERILPRYAPVPRMPPRLLRKAIRHALDHLRVPADPLPADLRRRHDLPGLADALRAVHRPETAEEAGLARRRFVFEELYTLQRVFAKARRERRRRTKRPAGAKKGDAALGRFLRALPFALTADQEGVIDELREDLRSGRPMERLIIGDVGSGKTVVAAAAMAHAVGAGGQAALLVPTEVLARQHHQTLNERFSPLGVAVHLLTGDLPAAERRGVLEAAAGGGGALFVGTHALLEEGVRFRKLTLAVVDEQHRFGVRQRSVLPAKGEKTHFLLLSATPIPRSLALTLYGDLDLSFIRTLPPGRKPVATRRLSGKERKEAYAALRGRLSAGEQGFVLFPLVEDSEKSDRRAAVTAARKLAEGYFRDFTVGLLHGRMPVAERIDTVDRVRSGEIDLLVSTTVVEVGVDLPRATVMVVEHADRFGLSQLHQIRGRVGRSRLPSFCFLLTDGPVTDQAEERLAVLEREHDGFRIAEADLRLRGPGDLLGERQHGPSGMGIADLLADTDLLELARREAFAFEGDDPPLPAPLRSG